MNVSFISERRRSYVFHRLLTTGCIALVFGSPDAASAQVSDSPVNGQELVVTAQRREQRLMDVPVAVSAVTGTTLAQNGIRETRDIVQVLPGITFNDSGPNTTFSVRGVSLNDLGDSNESPIAYYRDDVYIAALAGAQSQMFDISRVELLRGPQGTLFGRNATGGVVQLISNQPTANYTGDLSLQYGSYNQVVVNAAVGGPLIGDVVLGRTSFTYDRDDGWQHNVVTNTRTARTNDWALRQLIDIHFTENLKGQFNIHGGADNDVASIYGARGAYIAPSGTYNPATQVATGDFCSQAEIISLSAQCTNYFGFRDPNPSPTKVYSTLAHPSSKMRNFGSSYTMDYDGGRVNLKSITAYERTRKLYTEDGDPGPQLEFVDEFGALRQQISQELRASGDAGGLHWTAGFYYFTEHLTNGFYTIPNFVALFGTYGSQNQYRERTQAGAGFGQVDYKIRSNLTLTVGARYSQERKTLNITDSVTAPTYEEKDVARSHAPTWKAALAWNVTPGWLTYASVSTGFKSPGFNTSAVTEGGSVPSEAERLTAYEVGAKGKIWGDRIQLTGAIYYNHYAHFQLIDGVQDGLFVVSRLINIPLAQIYGAEADISVRPIGGLHVDLNGSFTHSKIVAPGDFLGAQDLNGGVVTNTPKFTVKGSIEYRWVSSKYGRFNPHLNVDYQSSFFPTVSCEYYTSCKIPGYTLVNAGIEWTPPGQSFHVEIFANNLFNKAYQNGGYYFGDVSAEIWGRPRLMGIRLSKHW